MQWRPRLHGIRIALPRYAPDASVQFVPVRMPEARLIMTNDRVVPIANIKCAIGPELHVHRTERPAGACDQMRQGRMIHDPEARAVILYLQRPHGIVKIAAHDHRALPLVGEMTSL